MYAELEEAKAAGDDEKRKELETRGPEMQQMMHMQGFGTASVDNVLEVIQNELPKIAKQANVQVIVSKWDIAWSQENADLIDVTDLMIKPFAPDEATMKAIQGVRKTDPVPESQLKNHID